MKRSITEFLFFNLCFLKEYAFVEGLSCAPGVRIRREKKRSEVRIPRQKKRTEVKLLKLSFQIVILSFLERRETIDPPKNFFLKLDGSQRSSQFIF